MSKNKLICTVALCALTGMFTSCLSDSDDTTGTDTCTITAVTLGNMKRVTTVTSTDGTVKDTVVTFGASSYTMTIDDDTKTIENTDSLPYGTKTSAVLVTITYNGYLAGYRESGNEEATANAYSSTDSIDFTTPQDFYVYSTNGENLAIYTMKLNVHQVKSDVFAWRAMTPDFDLDKMTDILLGSKENVLYVWGVENGALHLYTSEDGSLYSDKGNVNLSNPDFKTLQQKGDSFYINDTEGNIWESTDGYNWSVSNMEEGYTLVAAGTQSLYAIKDRNLYQWTSQWSAASLDTLSTLLPTQDIVATVAPLPTNSNLDRITLIGRQGADEAYAPQTWFTITSNLTQQQTAWYHIPAVSGYSYPDWTNMATFAYNNEIIAFGNSSRSGSFTNDMTALYVSHDNGITWKESETYELPTELAGETGVFAATVDAQNFVWIVKDGRMWRGRLNKLSFEEQ